MRLCSEALTYVPCQIDPGVAPDAIYAFAPEADGGGECGAEPGARASQRTGAGAKGLAVASDGEVS